MEHNRDIYWELKTGGLIKIKDMSDSHLSNTIKMIEEKRWFGDSEKWLTILVREYQYRKLIYRSSKINKLLDNIKKQTHS